MAKILKTAIFLFIIVTALFIVFKNHTGINSPFVKNKSHLEELINKYGPKEAYQEVIDSYREFVKNPLGWQAKRGLEPRKEGGTQ